MNLLDLYGRNKDNMNEFTEYQNKVADLNVGDIIEFNVTEYDANYNVQKATTEKRKGKIVKLEKSRCSYVVEVSGEKLPYLVTAADVVKNHGNPNKKEQHLTGKELTDHWDEKREEQSDGMETSTD